MHPENRPLLFGLRKLFDAFYRAGNNIRNHRVLFGEVGGEIHFFPIEHKFKEIPYHLYIFLIPRRGKPKSEPIVFPLTK